VLTGEAYPAAAICVLAASNCRASSTIRPC
jgi:hypothetical protein